MNDSLRAIIENKKLLIFDFDGTIANTTPLHEKPFKHVLSPYTDAFDYELVAGLKTSDAIIKSLKKAGIINPSLDLVDSLSTHKQTLVRTLIEQDLRPIPIITKLLHHVFQKYRLALVTSGSRTTVTLALEKLEYENYFSPCLFAEDVLCSKPSPEGFLKALELTDLQESDALVFEDSEAGFEAAIRAGIDVYDINLLHY